MNPCNLDYKSYHIYFLFLHGVMSLSTIMDFKINQQERNALKGLPHLPRLTYLEAIRPYMDYATGIVGIRRGISYQSLREELYVETQRGNAGGSPSKDQMRRAVKTLERAELISIQSEGKRLILKCELATTDYCDQNLLARRAPHDATTRAPSKNISKTSDCDFKTEKANISKNALPATPPVSGINNIIFCLENAFEKFWQMYPVKNGQAKTWEIFLQLSPTPELFSQIIGGLEKQCAHYQTQKAQGNWMPHWRNPSNWLTQQGWNDELMQTQIVLSAGENKHARQYVKQSKSSDALWDYCKDAFVDECDKPENNIISINEYKQKQRSH